MTVSLSQRSYRVFSSTLNFAWQFSYQWNRRYAILPQTQICKFGRTKFDTHTILSCDEVLISLIIPLQVLLSSWRSAWKVQLCSLDDLAFHLQNCRIQQKLQETHKICLWLEGKRSSHIKGIRLSVIQFNRNYMKLTKFGTLVNKTTSLFISIRDSKISRGCVKIFEIPEGRGGGVNFGGQFWKIQRGRGGHTANPFRGGGGYGYFLEPHNSKISKDYWSHRRHLKNSWVKRAYKSNK